jgi:hypothetical protein
MICRTLAQEIADRRNGPMASEGVGSRLVPKRFAVLELSGDKAGNAGDQRGESATGKLEQGSVKGVKPVVDPMQFRIHFVEAPIDFSESPLDFIETVIDVLGEVVQPIVGPALSHLVHVCRS